jgi:hypothetical protein
LPLERVFNDIKGQTSNGKIESQKSMPIRKVHVGKKFPVNSCLPDFPVKSSTVYQGEIRKTGICEKKFNQTRTFAIGIQKSDINGCFLGNA